MRKPRKEYLISAEDDGLIADKVGPWAADKYRHVGMYAEIFSTGMKNLWPTRLYLDLFEEQGTRCWGSPKGGFSRRPYLH